MMSSKGGNVLLSTFHTRLTSLLPQRNLVIFWSNINGLEEWVVEHCRHKLALTLSTQFFFEIAK